jgi:hypothetical protein
MNHPQPAVRARESLLALRAADFLDVSMNPGKVLLQKGR